MFIKFEITRYIFMLCAVSLFSESTTEGLSRASSPGAFARAQRSSVGVPMGKSGRTSGPDQRPNHPRTSGQRAVGGREVPRDALGRRSNHHRNTTSVSGERRVTWSPTQHSFVPSADGVNGGQSAGDGARQKAVAHAQSTVEPAGQAEVEEDSICDRVHQQDEDPGRSEGRHVSVGPG